MSKRSMDIHQNIIHNPVKRFFALLIDHCLRWLFDVLQKSRHSPYGTHNLADGFVPHRILVMQLDHIGDTIMATPVYASLRKAYKNARITAVVGPWSEEMLRSDPNVDNIIVHATPWFANARIRGRLRQLITYLRYLPAYIKLLRQIRNEGYDLAIDLRGDLRHILLYAYLGRCQFRISFDRTGGDYLLTTVVPFHAGEHVVYANQRLIEACGVHHIVQTPFIHFTSQDQIAAMHILRTNGHDPALPYAIMHPGARTLVRRWPPERFALLADWLMDRYHVKTVIVGSEDELKLAQTICANMNGQAIILTGRLRLLETAALLRQASIFIGNESSIMHMAAYSGTKVVALYGPMEPAQTMPLSRDATILFERFPCCPCKQDKCLLWDRSWGKCIDTININAVKWAIKQTLPNRIGLVSDIQPVPLIISPQSVPVQ